MFTPGTRWIGLNTLLVPPKKFISWPNNWTDSSCILGFILWSITCLSKKLAPLGEIKNFLNLLKSVRALIVEVFKPPLIKPSVIVSIVESPAISSFHVSLSSTPGRGLLSFDVNLLVIKGVDISAPYPKVLCWNNLVSNIDLESPWLLPPPS